MWSAMMGFGFLLVVGLIAWLVWAAQRGTLSTNAYPAVPGGVTYAAPRQPAAASDTAEAIVRERFARGEIDRDEYDRLIAALRAS